MISFNWTDNCKIEMREIGYGTLNMQINLSKINNPVINNKILFILAL